MSTSRNRRAFDAEKMPFIPCIGCTPKQVTELTCYYCDKTKGLDEFFLAQRKKRDTAVSVVSETIEVEIPSTDNYPRNARSAPRSARLWSRTRMTVIPAVAVEAAAAVATAATTTVVAAR
jgi:hypothetical protein